MLKGNISHKMSVCCPVCRMEEFQVNRRTPTTEGRVNNECACKRCGSSFEYEEDRTGRPLKK